MNNYNDIPDGAAWIWCADDHAANGRMAYFRLTFEGREAATWTGFADTFYTIFINGQSLGIGPVTGIHTQPRLTTWDLTPYLMDDNVLSIEVWFEGDGADPPDVDVYRPGMIGWLTTPTQVFPTGPSWKAVAGSTYEMASANERFFGAKRVVIGNLRDEPRGWISPGYDDAAWPAAAIVAEHPDPARPELRHSPIPPLGNTDLRPALINAGWARGDEPVNGAEDVAKRVIAQRLESMIRPTHEFSVLALVSTGIAFGLPAPDKIAGLGWPSAVIDGFAGPLTMPAEVEADFYTVWDCGRQISGNLWLEVDSPAGLSIDFAYADHLQNGRVNPRLQGHSYADRLVVGSGRQTIHTPHERGFRYVQISFSAWATIHDLRAHEHVYPHDDIVRFRCSDDTLNGVWDMAAATLHQCSLSSHCDNTRRERQGWGGPDLYAMSHGFFAAFGDLRLTRKMLEDYCDFFDVHAFIPNWYPATAPSVRWISAHDIWFPTVCWDYIVHSGDRNLAPRLLAASEAVMAYYDSARDGDLLGKANEGACRWAEWNMNAAQAVSTWENLLAVVGWRSVANLRDYVGAPGSADAVAASESLTAAINARLWRPDRGALAQGTRNDGSLVDHCGQLDNAFALLHGILTPDRAEAAYRFCAGRSGTWPTSRSDWQGSGQGERVRYDPRKPVVTGTPFGSSVCARTMFAVGQATEAMQYIRYNFGAMIDEGEGTLWEMWPVHQGEDISATCFSQGYGGHIASTLIRCFLGVTFEEPGGTTLNWRPNPCDLAWLEGQVETIHGPVTFRVDEKGASYQAPEGVTVIMG